MAPSRSPSIMLLNNPCLTNDVLDSPSSSQRASFHGYSVTTTITSSARRPATTPRAKRHHDDRKRFPTTEALFQIVFRGLTLLLHIAAIVLVWALDRENVVSGFVGTRVLYGLISYAILLNTWKLIALADLPLPLPELSSSSLPHTEPVRYMRYVRFPRLQPLYLVVAETAALATTIWASIVLLNEYCLDEIRPADCPLATCVTVGEKLGVWGYIVEVMAALMHMVFWVDAWASCLVGMW